MGGRASRNSGKKGERDVGRLFLRKGYLAWRTAQNRQSKLDTESDDVSTTMAPEHMRCAADGTEDRRGDHLDLYYVDQDTHPERGQHTKPISEFEQVPNLTIEVKNGYNDVHTRTKKFQDWLDRLKQETPEGNAWALFWRRKYAPRFAYRVCYRNFNDITVITVDKEQTMKAIDKIARLAQIQGLAHDKPSIEDMIEEARREHRNGETEPLSDLCD